MIPRERPTSHCIIPKKRRNDTTAYIQMQIYTKFCCLITHLCPFGYSLLLIYSTKMAANVMTGSILYMEKTHLQQPSHPNTISHHWDTPLSSSCHTVLGQVIRGHPVATEIRVEVVTKAETFQAPITHLARETQNGT